MGENDSNTATSERGSFCNGENIYTVSNLHGHSLRRSCLSFLPWWGVAQVFFMLLREIRNLNLPVYALYEIFSSSFPNSILSLTWYKSAQPDSDFLSGSKSTRNYYFLNWHILLCTNNIIYRIRNRQFNITFTLHAGLTVTYIIIERKSI